MNEMGSSGDLGLGDENQSDSVINAIVRNVSSDSDTGGKGDPGSYVQGDIASGAPASGT